ncbi:MAG: type I-D CRISPR-associated endonuclease Cas1, partial [Thermodesulfatator sp.]
MGVCYITTEDALVKTELDRLVVTHEGRKILDLPLIKIEQVVLVGRVGLTSGAVAALMKNGIPVAYLSSSGRPLGRLDPIPNR